MSNLPEKSKPTVKLLRWIAIKPLHKLPQETRDTHWPGEGLWQTSGVREFVENGYWKRVFTITCIASLGGPHVVGDTRDIYEDVLRVLYDEIIVTRKSYSLPPHLIR